MEVEITKLKQKIDPAATFDEIIFLYLCLYRERDCIFDNKNYAELYL